MSQVSKWVEVGNHQQRTLNTWLFSVTSTEIFACLAGPYLIKVLKQVRKTNLTCFLYQFKKRGRIQSSSFEPKVSLKLFSRGSGPLLTTRTCTGPAVSFQKHPCLDQSQTQPFWQQWCEYWYPWAVSLQLLWRVGLSTIPLPLYFVRQSHLQISKFLLLWLRHKVPPNRWSLWHISVRSFVFKPDNRLDPVNLLSLCFGYCSPLVQWNCNRYNKSSKPKRETEGWVSSIDFVSMRGGGDLSKYKFLISSDSSSLSEFCGPPKCSLRYFSVKPQPQCPW